jgi:cell division protein FtsW (lipid II flippase)
VAFEEKRAWIMLVTSVVGYLVYLVLVAGQLGDRPVDDVAYIGALLWTIGGAIVVNILANMALGIVAREDAGKRDERDREIGRFGEYIGQSFVVIGGLAALIMAMLELDHFWIANAVYLCFALSSVLGSIAKVFAYRRGFQQW